MTSYFKLHKGSKIQVEETLIWHKGEAILKTNVFCSFKANIWRSFGNHMKVDCHPLRFEVHLFPSTRGGGGTPSVGCSCHYISEMKLKSGKGPRLDTLCSISCLLLQKLFWVYIWKFWEKWVTEYMVHIQKMKRHDFRPQTFLKVVQNGPLVTFELMGCLWSNLLLYNHSVTPKLTKIYIRKIKHDDFQIYNKF